jgi:hypothetical protein
VVVEGDVVLAGALGSVGQKVVARQAAKMTAAFAESLRSALDGSGHVTAAAPDAAPGAMAAVAAVVGGEDGTDRPDGPPPVDGSGWQRIAPPGTAGRPWPDGWAVAALALAGMSLAVGVATYLRVRRLPR